MSVNREATFAGRNLWDELVELRNEQRKERAN